MNELIPIVAQDYKTGYVRMVGVGNEKSIKMSDERGKLTFWSRTKGRIWIKGETSGDFLEVRNPTDLRYSFESGVLKKSIIYRVRQVFGKSGKTCHRGTPTCFTGGKVNITESENLLTSINYQKMGGKVIVVLQNSINQKIIKVLTLSSQGLQGLLGKVSQTTNNVATVSVDCDRDTLLIRVPMEIVSSTS